MTPTTGASTSGQRSARRRAPSSGSRYRAATAMYAGFTEPRRTLRTSASNSSARVVVPSGGSSVRNADDTTSSVMAVVNASCEIDDALWNTATGTRPAAHNAHFERGERAMATPTTATYIASTTNRATTSMASASKPRLRVTKTDADCGRYGTNDGNVENVTKPSLRSDGHGWMGPGSYTTGLPVSGSTTPSSV